MTLTTRSIVLAQIPVGHPGPDTWRLETADVPVLGEGEALVRTRYLSLDPAMRGWINGVDTYVPAVKIGEVMRASGVGEVVESRSDRYPVGSLVSGLLGWQEHAVASATNPMQVLPEGTDPKLAVGVLGVTGLTAYFGLLDLGQPKEGETVLVSGAAGATGSAAGQIAKILGCRVVGIAGGPEKCALLTDVLGFDEAIDYKAGDVRPAIAASCPGGVDVFFDNVGGDILEAGLTFINLNARIVLCGGISGYNEVEPRPGPRNIMNLVLKRARMEGFIVIDYRKRFPEAVAQLAQWVAAGQLRQVDTVVHGLENAPKAFDMLFSGGNTGKLMIEV
ncbi:MAG TPA: NADP-dependent oxidoreductase [Acidimicrobiales bacterium]